MASWLAFSKAAQTFSKFALGSFNMAAALAS